MDSIKPPTNRGMQSQRSMSFVNSSPITPAGGIATQQSTYGSAGEIQGGSSTLSGGTVDLDEQQQIGGVSGLERTGLSEQEKKIFRDAFELFDTDGDGSVTKVELKHVMETLFDKQLQEEEVEQMINDVDLDNDGEISFEEFTFKVADVIQNLNDPDKQDGSSASDEHWQSLSRLISHFSEQETNPQNKSPTHKKLLPTTKKREMQKRQKQVISNQHDAMVAHFNLRRLSIDGMEDVDDMEKAIRQIEASERAHWRNRCGRIDVTRAAKR